MHTRTGVPFSRVHTMPAEVKATSDGRGGARIVEGTATSSQLDRQGEHVHIAAIERAMPDYMRNPIMCYAHDWYMPVGKWTEYGVADGKLRLKGELMPPGDEFADQVWRRIEGGFVKGISVGFNPVGSIEKSGGEDDAENWWWGGPDGDMPIDVLEYSLVPIPANTDAQDLQVAKGLGLDASQPWKQKGAVAFANLTLGPEDHVWDSNAAEKRLRKLADGDMTLYRSAHLWHDADNADDYSAYHLPIADVVDGEVVAVWRGCAAAAIALAGGRGGVNIPSGDLASVKSTLRRYYGAFSKQWPDELSEAISFVKQVNWQAGEQDIAEEARCLENLSVATGRWEGVANIARHWESNGRVLSPSISDAVLRSMSLPISVLRAGRVLSDTNRAAVTDARDALSDVLARDEESKGRAPAEEVASDTDDGEKSTLLQAAWRGSASA